MKSEGLVPVLAILLILTTLPVVLGQPEPSSPEQEWYPPTPEQPSELRVYALSEAGSGVPGAAGTVSMQIVDEAGRIRREQYGSEKICLQFVTPFSTFYMFLYEWYPPGTYPQGHWLIYAAGPFSMWSGAIIKVCYFVPEPGEPEGLHTWKLWLYDPQTRSWSTGIYRFNYFAFPRAVIERVEYPSELLVGGRYELKVTVKNLGEVDYTYTMYAEASGASLEPGEQSIRVPASSSASVTFRLTVSATAPVLNLRLQGDGRTLDSRSVTLAARVLNPGPMTLGDVSPTVLREGEEVQLTFRFINKGQGRAENVYAQIEAPGFQVISGLESLPNVDGGAEARAVFRVRPVEGGVKTLRVVIKYADIVGNRYVDTIESAVTVLVKLQVDARSAGGTTLRIPVLVNGREYERFDEWINPLQPLTLEARGEVASGDTKYVFKGWSDGESAPKRTVALQRSASLSAIYTAYHKVTVVTPYSRGLGDGWYEEGATATVSLEQTSIGIGVKQVFDHWEDEQGRTVSTSPSYSFVVAKPTTLKAVWRTDYTELLTLLVLAAAAITAGVVLRRSRKRPLPPPPPP